MGLGLGPNQSGEIKQSEHQHQHLSASLLWIPCDQLPHTSAAKESYQDGLYLFKL